ncbi:MAG: sulfite exporter TauE/SafE family protein [Paludibacteraceae bacterium]|nr:sulfite exporter TauE/SafE family protein [Paludibacteraceae bacterium]
MELLQGLLETTSFPFLSAFLLGLMMTISPCPFCSNLTAIGFIGKDVQNKATITWNGLMYIAGKMLTYFALALIFLIGIDMLPIRRFFETYGEPILGPFLIVCGVAMLSVVHFHHHHHHEDEHEHTHGPWTERLMKSAKLGSPWWSFLLGIALSLAFCPYSGMIFFGMLIPLSVTESVGWALPLVFGFATGLPVLLISWALAYSVATIGKLHHNIQVIEVWLRRICAVLFIVMGIYITVEVFGGHHHHHHHHCTEESCTEHVHIHE